MAINYCPTVERVITGIDWRQSNFESVPSAKFPDIAKIYPNGVDVCVQPERISLPGSLVIIDKFLAKGKKVSLYVHEKDQSGGGIGESRWENLYLKLYGTNDNFTLIDSAHFKKAERKESIANLKGDSVDSLDLMSQQERFKVIEMTGVTHMYVIDYKRNRSGPFKTDYYSGRLIDAYSGKIIAVDTLED